MRKSVNRNKPLILHSNAISVPNVSVHLCSFIREDHTEVRETCNPVACCDAEGSGEGKEMGIKKVEKNLAIQI